MSTAVFGAPEFKTRSGRVVVLGEDGSLSIDHKRGYLSPGAVMDAEEFFQAKRDEELGRWRWPENPDYVVYLHDDAFDSVRVLHEASGFVTLISRDDARTLAMGGGMYSDAARAYFEAHPERDLPTENGVYVPATAGLEQGPLTFVLYNESWRATPESRDAAELAREWHARTGLMRLAKLEDAS